MCSQNYIGSMKKMLLLLITIPALAFAQVPGNLSVNELRAQQRKLDSLRALTAKAHRDTEAHNDAYIRKHPNYLRQHPEILKAHPEYQKRYAKYLSHPSPTKR